METSNTFSIKRVVLLMQRHLFYNLKTYLLSFAAVGSMIFIISLLSTFASDNLFSEDLFVTLGLVFLFIGGILLTSNIFKEISSKHRGWLYMMLPANPSEKVLSYWLLTTIGYAIIATLTMVLLSIIISIFSTLIFQTAFYVFNPFFADYFEILAHYCIAQSLFFFGAIYFQKNNFLKTILSVIIFNHIVGIIAVVIIYSLFGLTSFKPSELPFADDYFFTVLVPNVAKVIYYGFMVPFFLTVSYFKFKEREV